MLDSHQSVSQSQFFVTDNSHTKIEMIPHVD